MLLDDLKWTTGACNSQGITTPAYDTTPAVGSAAEELVCDFEAGDACHWILADVAWHVSDGFNHDLTPWGPFDDHTTALTDGEYTQLC